MIHRPATPGVRVWTPELMQYLRDRTTTTETIPPQDAEPFPLVRLAATPSTTTVVTIRRD